MKPSTKWILFAGVIALVCGNFQNSWAHLSQPVEYKTKPILADLKVLRSLKIPVMLQDEATGVGFTYITPKIEMEMSASAHLNGRCGSFEALDETSDLSIMSMQKELNSLRQIQGRDLAYRSLSSRKQFTQHKPEIQAAIDQVSDSNIGETVTWLSSYPNRYNKGATPNKHVEDFQKKLEEFLKSTSAIWEVSTIDHKSTKQKSLRVRILGKSRPDELIVLGGHLDSISYDAQGRAPGADDNASGSAAIYEALRIFATQGQPDRTVEFFFYAGEESGLLGSAEIAKSYKAASKNVVAALQLDMTMFAGSGEFVISSINDFTSTWLQDYLKEINGLYTKVKIIEDQCGYACSDHASWYRQGYPAVFPFEAHSDVMNQKIHTIGDVVSNTSNFKHAAVFAKLALVFALDLANSEQRQPF